MLHNELVNVSNGLLELELRSSPFHRSIARSLDRSLDRSIARSIARSLARSIARSIARSLDHLLFYVYLSFSGQISKIDQFGVQ